MAKNKREEKSLREAAEELIRTGKANVANLDTNDMGSLLHELSVHQVELEAQNENLRQAQRQAEEAQQHYSLLFHDAPVAYLVLSHLGIIEEVNRQGERLLGRPASMLRGTPIRVYLLADSLGVFNRHFNATVSTEEKQRCEVVVVNRSTGAGLNVLMESISLPTVPKHHRIRTALIDITEKKRAEEALKRARDELEERVKERTDELEQAYKKLVEETQEKERIEHQLRQAQKQEALGTLAGGIAHDFNNILAAIIGFSELVHDHLPEGNRERRLTENVLKAGIRGRELIRQLLTFTRYTAEEKKPLRLSGIIKETVALLRSSLPTTIRINTTLGSESLVFADPVQIEQVLMNLATNAAYAMREKGGILDIALSDFAVAPSTDNPDGIEPGTYMKLVVSDTGSGIPPGVLDKIFDPFFTTKQVGEGTGLGLSVVMGIIKQSHGCITVESREDKGSTFTIYLPVMEDEPTADEANRDGIPTGHERILFVDDEEALVEVGEELLAELGYEVTGCTGSGEALALFGLDPSRFDLVITDQTMPDITGVELTREMIALRPDVRVLLCTGFSQNVNEESSKTAGIKGFIMKPLSKREIAEAIRKALDE